MRYLGFLIVLALPACSADLAERQNRARLLLSQKDFLGALEEAAAANRDRPDDITGYQLVAAAHLGLGDYDDADKALQWMLDLRIGKADAEGWLLLSRFREATGDIEGALEAVNAGYARLLPDQMAQARILMLTAARLLRTSGKLALAEQALREISQDDADSLEERGLLRIAQGRRREAIELLRRASKLNSHPRLLYRLAVATSEPADSAEFERAARERSGRPDNANRELTLHLVRAAQPGEALAIARRESKRRHDVGTMDALAVALFANGQTDEARSVMKNVLAVGTRDPEVLEHAAQMGLHRD
jgi:Flp pilus assembly protein TadD